MTPPCNRCGSDPDEHANSPDCSSGKHPRTVPPRAGPVLILALAVVGLVFFPLAVFAVVFATRHRKRLEAAGLPESRIARLGLVLAVAGILAGLIQLLALVYLLPTLLSPGIEDSEKAAISALRELCRVQSNHRQLTGKYAPGLKLLRERGFLDSNFKELQAYRLELTVSENLDNYQARAIPRKPGLRHFFIDQTGVLRRSDSADIGPHSPAVDVSLQPTHSESP